MSIAICPELDAANLPEPISPSSGAGAARLRDSRRRSVEALQRMTALGEMVTGIAHDFRNLLGVIQSAIRLAGAFPDEVDHRQACLAAAQEGVERGLGMTFRLLAFSKPREPVAGFSDINELLRDLEMFLKYSAGPGIAVVLRLAEDASFSAVDPAQFNAAILNLVVNARDAMPEGGIIEISTTMVDAGSSLDRAVETSKYLRVRVKDTGQGMPQEVSCRIFDPYFTTKGDTGNGLGVPQVCAFVDGARGYVSIDSQVGKGTIFDLFFPADTDVLPPAPGLWGQLDRWINEGGADEPPGTARTGLRPG